MTHLETPLTNYDNEASHFACLPDYSIECGTDYLAVRDVPNIIHTIQPLQKILDLGCGTGLATRFIKKHFPQVNIIGADINQKMLEQAMKADPQGIYIHIPSANGEIHYPFMPATFDVVICSFVVHENRTLTELKSFLHHIRSFLRPKGLLLLWDAHHNLSSGKWATIEVLSTGPMKDACPFTVRLYPSKAEVTGTYWSPETIMALMKELNFATHEIHFPLANSNDPVIWYDETRLPPYLVLEARK